MQLLFRWLGRFKSPIGFLVAILVLVFRACGVDILPLAGHLSVALTNFSNAAAALVPLGFAVWGQIQLARKHGALKEAVLAAVDAGAPASRVLLVPSPIASQPIFPGVKAPLGAVAGSASSLSTKVPALVLIGIASTAVAILGLTACVDLDVAPSGGEEARLLTGAPAHVSLAQP